MNGQFLGIFLFLEAVLSAHVEWRPNQHSDISRYIHDNFPPEMLAAAYGNTTQLDYLLSQWPERRQGANVRDWVGQTPLHIAAKFGKLESVKMLVESGASIDPTNRDFDETPLHLASKSGYHKIVKVLLSQGADVNAVINSSQLAFDYKGGTPLTYAIEAGGDCYETVKVLLEGGAKVDLANFYKHTPLHLAAKHQNLRTADLLLKYDAGIDARDVNGLTPLGYLLVQSVERPRHAFIYYLLRKGAGLDIEDNNGTSPMEHIIFRGLTRTIQFLPYRGEEINRVSSSGIPFLNRIMRNESLRSPDAVRTLMAFGVDPNQGVTTCQGPLHDLASLTSDEFLRDEGAINEIAWILINNGADPAIVDPCSRISARQIAYSTGKATLFNAFKRPNGRMWDYYTSSFPEQNNDKLENRFSSVAKGATEDVGILLSRTPVEQANEVDEIHQTALHIAAYFGQNEVAMMLVFHGSDVNAKDAFLRTPLHLAARTGNAILIEFLINTGARLEERDKRGNTPLLTAALHSNSVKAVRTLISHGARVNVTNNLGLSGLHLAAVKQYFEIMEVLLAAGVSVDVRSRLGQTPLHYLLNSRCCYPQMPTIDLLLNNGADVNSKDRFGRQPIHAAINTEKQSEVFLLLLYNGADVHATDYDGCLLPLPYYLQQVLNIDYIPDAEIAQTVTWMIQFGASPRRADRCNPTMTPLELTMMSNHPKTWNVLRQN